MDRLLLSEISKEVCKKKELADIDSEVIQSTILRVLKRYPAMSSNSSDSDRKIVVKEVRGELRKMAGQYSVTEEKETRDWDQNKVEEILDSHASTRERKESYPFLRDQLLGLNPRSILDLGCGLNPLAIATSDREYFAVDINKKNLNLVQNFFSWKGISGKIYSIDLRALETGVLPKADLAILWKIVDLLDKKGHKTTERVIDSLNCKNVWISFSTKTLSGRPMNHPQRGWIERLLKRKGYSFSVFSQRNEIFYLATRNN